MALVDHEVLYLLKVHSRGGNHTVWLSNLHASQFYAILLAGELVEFGFMPTPDTDVQEIDTITPDWVSYKADGEAITRDEFIQMFCENSSRTYEANTPW